MQAEGQTSARPNYAARPKTKDEVIGSLRIIRKVDQCEENDLEIISNSAIIEQFSGFTKGIKLFALCVSIIALVVAALILRFKK